MNFTTVIGQVDAKTTLQRMADTDRIPHALLLLGPEGCGKLALALAVSQYVLCEDKQPEGACERCRSCIKAGKWAHPDLHFSFPTVGTNVKSESFLPQWRSLLAQSAYPKVHDWLQRIGAENKQGNINKEECLNIVRKLSLKPFESSYKILLMWMPEYLGKEGNRLLKLIEEPPAQTLFILVAERQELILNTILSRCQTVRLNALQDDEIVQGLMQAQQLPEEEALGIAQLANGNFTEALQLAQSSENDNARLFLEWMRKCYVGNSVELVEWTGNFAGVGRENQKFFLRYALHFMREYLLFQTTNDIHKTRLGSAERQTAQGFKKVIGFQQLEQIVTLLNELMYHVERNANPKVLFLDAGLRMHQFLRKQ